MTGQPLEVPFDDEDTLDITVPLEQIVLTKDHFHAPLSMVEARYTFHLVRSNDTNK